MVPPCYCYVNFFVLFFYTGVFELSCFYGLFLLQTNVRGEILTSLFVRSTMARRWCRCHFQNTFYCRRYLPIAWYQLYNTTTCMIKVKALLAVCNAHRTTKKQVKWIWAYLSPLECGKTGRNSSYLILWNNLKEPRVTKNCLNWNNYIVHPHHRRRHGHVLLVVGDDLSEHNIGYIPTYCWWWRLP